MWPVPFVKWQNWPQIRVYAPPFPKKIIHAKHWKFVGDHNSHLIWRYDFASIVAWLNTRIVGLFKCNFKKKSRIGCRIIYIILAQNTFVFVRFQVEIHEDFIQSCFDRLKASYDTLCVLDGDKDSINCARQEAIRMVRVLTVLKEYINECDSDYHEERTILPMSRCSHNLSGRFLGNNISAVLFFPDILQTMCHSFVIVSSQFFHPLTMPE